MVSNCCSKAYTIDISKCQCQHYRSTLLPAALDLDLLHIFRLPAGVSHWGLLPALFDCHQLCLNAFYLRQIFLVGGFGRHQFLLIANMLFGVCVVQETVRQCDLFQLLDTVIVAQLHHVLAVVVLTSWLLMLLLFGVLFGVYKCWYHAKVLQRDLLRSHCGDGYLQLGALHGQPIALLGQGSCCARVVCQSKALQPDGGAAHAKRRKLLGQSWQPNKSSSNQTMKQKYQQQKKYIQLQLFTWLFQAGRSGPHSELSGLQQTFATWSATTETPSF